MKKPFSTLSKVPIGSSPLAEGDQLFAYVWIGSRKFPKNSHAPMGMTAIGITAPFGVKTKLTSAGLGNDTPCSQTDGDRCQQPASGFDLKSIQRMLG